jgi:uncharacterized protein (TIGR00730 family)
MSKKHRKITHKDDVHKELKKKHFRVSIFGSARIKPDDGTYKLVFNLAEKIGNAGYDVITGGGPGLMEAANAGHEAGNNGSTHNADSIGLTIELPWEAGANDYLDEKEHFQKFSERLDHFMALSNVVVVAPGGIGTCLELFYTWQLTQVKHICPISIIVVGDMWEQLMKWIDDYPLKAGLISPGDTNNIFCAKDEDKAFKIIEKMHKLYEELGDKACVNTKMYRLDI